MFPAGFEPTIPPREPSQNLTLDRAAIGIGARVKAQSKLKNIEAEVISMWRWLFAASEMSNKFIHQRRENYQSDRFNEHKRFTTAQN